MMKIKTILLLSLLLGAALCGHGEPVKVPTDTASLWELRQPDQRGQTLRAVDYSPAVGALLELTMEPARFPYAELVLREPVEIADSAAAMKGSFSFEFLAAPAASLQEVSIRLVDATGETFQYKIPKNLRGGTWEKITVGVARPTGVWGGNKDRKLDFPVRLLALTIDCRNTVEGQTTVFIDNLRWNPQGN